MDAAVDDDRDGDDLYCDHDYFHDSHDGHDDHDDHDDRDDDHHQRDHDELS